MFEVIIEDMARATLADYDRLVSRLLSEKRAAAANASRERNPQPNRRYLPWSLGWHRRGAAS